MKATFLRTRRWPAVLLGAVVLAVVLAGLRLTSSRTAPSRSSATGVPTILVASLAVTANGAEPWSGVGLAEQVRTALSADNSVAVRRLERTRPVAEDDASEIAAARRIGADYLLLGTLGRKGRDSEIALRLVRSADASTAWTGTFWRSPADFPSFADDLAAAVTEAIHADRDREARERER